MSENNFEIAVKRVLEYEGGYVNDAWDPGKETKYGISKRVYSDLDIENLTVEQATQIYRRDYWDKCRCGELPGGVDVLVFDCAVNQGQYAAGIILQQSVGATVDGIIGPQTISCSEATDPVAAIKEIAARRGVKYGKLLNFSRYGLGWMRRLMGIYSFALDLL